MSINDMMKLQGVGAASPIAPGNQAASDALRQSAKAPAEPKAKAKEGVAVEVSNNVSAGEPPVAADRVQEVRSALQDGTYPIVPAQIADAMIAARLSLTVTS